MFDSIRREKLRDVFITKTAIKTNLSEQNVLKILSFVWKKTHQSFKEDDTIEISGFGKFIRSTPKMNRKLNTLLKAREVLERKLSNELDPLHKASIESRIKAMTETINFINQRLNENQYTSNNRGVEESSNTGQGDERIDLTSVQGEIK